MTKDFKLKHGIFYLLMTQALSIFISFLTDVFMSFADWDVFIPAVYSSQLLGLEERMEEFFGAVALLPVILPFSLIILISIGYLWPLLRKQNYLINQQVLLNRIITLPLFALLSTIGGWLLSAFIQMALYLIMGSLGGMLLPLFLSEAFVPFMTGVLIGILVYYIIEFINQSWLLPLFFHKGEIMEMKKSNKMSIRSRFLIFFISATVLPLGFINTITLASGANARPVLLYSLFFLFITLCITLFLTRVFRHPLIDLENTAKEIQSGNFKRRLKVTTADELGRLTHSMNRMSEGLAEKERINETLGRVVDPAIRDHLLSGDINLGGENYRATVLFSDIRNFTSLSEMLPAQTLIEMLNRYFSTITEAIEMNGGLVNKFIGDAVMALFGVPAANEIHSEQAVQAALEMKRRRLELNKEFIKENIPPIDAGIGIHTGPLIAGNIGSETRMEYTAIGDTVNVASRLESSCKKTGKDILLSETVHYGCRGNNDFIRVGNIKLKGRQEPITIYTI